MSLAPRSSPRIDAIEEVEIEIDGRLHKCRLRNLSMGGAGVQFLVEAKLEQGTDVILWIADWAPFPARVAWVGEDSVGLEYRVD